MERCRHLPGTPRAALRPGRARRARVGDGDGAGGTAGDTAWVTTLGYNLGLPLEFPANTALCRGVKSVEFPGICFVGSSGGPDSRGGGEGKGQGKAIYGFGPERKCNFLVHEA